MRSPGRFRERRLSVNRALAGAGGVLALLAVVAGSPRASSPEDTRAARAPGEGPGVPELTAELATGRASVDAVTLAEWIRDRRPSLAVVDLRDPGSFIRFAIPTATNLPLRALPDSLDPSAEIVLYDGGGGEAARAWLLLRRLGYPRVLVLERGLLGWLDEVISPVLPAHTPEQKRRFDQVAAVSRYFGGIPRVGFRDATGRDDPASTRDAVQLLTRRGCY